MEMQNYENKRLSLLKMYREKIIKKPDIINNELKLSWSNWGFGLEPLETSVKRLFKNNLRWMELHGNRYGDDLGYKGRNVMNLMKRYDMKISGVCGMFGPENDLSSNSGIIRQNAIDYIHRQLELCHEIEALYMLVVPGAVGRSIAYDGCEFERSVETLQIVADMFLKANVKAAIEPIRSAEVSLFIL